MANDNKNTHDLVSESDEDTSELEILPETIAADPDFDYESESDAATHAFESPSRDREDESLAGLKTELRERDEYVNRLEYDIEQLRSRWTGLETELKAREELTENVTAELAQARRQLGAARERIERREQTLAAVEAGVREHEDRRNDAERALEEAHRSVESLQTEIAVLNDRDVEAATRIQSLTDELNRERAERQQAQEAGAAQSRLFHELETRHAEARSQLESLREYVNGRREQWERQEGLLRAKDALLKEQKRKLARFTRDIKRETKLLRKEQACRQDLQTKNANLRQDNERLQQELAASRADWSGFEEAAGAADEMLKQRQQEVDRLAAQLEQMAGRQSAEESLRRDLESERDGLRDEFARLKLDNDSLREAAATREQSIALQQGEIDRLAVQIEQIGERLSAEESLRTERETERDGLRHQLARLQQDNDSIRQAAAAREESMALLVAEIDNLATALAELSDEFEKERSERLALEAQRNALEEKAEQQGLEIRAFSASEERERLLKRQHAELAGVLASNDIKLRELREQAAKTEAYADTLRRKLQNQLAESEVMAAGHANVQAALDTASAKVADLTARLEAEREEHAALAAELREHREKHEKETREHREKYEEEMRRIRHELDAARETIAENQSVNEQLTSDLIDNTGFRRALESQLAEADETNRKELSGLHRQLKRLKQEIDDYERKVSNKDAAINALLTELANKPHVVASDQDGDGVIHRLGGRRSHGPDDRGGHDKDRITRLLIGTIDGQEVRFPLFKNKLTIGRTAHNDIQLKAQYISRRHAVVVSDNDCTRIVDWGSKNGIYVNGIRASEKILKNGDQVTVGTAQFRFEERHKR